LLVFCLVLSLILFIAAGTLSWFYGRIFLILIYSLNCSLYVGAQAQPWIDRRAHGIQIKSTHLGQGVHHTGTHLLRWYLEISMPLDAVRFHWSQMPTWLPLVGVIVFLSSFYLTYLTYRENSYLSGVVRIQEDRGQTVISTGPYRYVRHPSAILYTPANYSFF